MSVAEYVAKFTELARFAPHMVDTDYKKARKFEGGLDLDILDRVGVLNLPTYVNVFDRALMAEAILVVKRRALAPITEWKGKRSGFSFKKNRSIGMNKKLNTGSSSSSSQSSGSTHVCTQCGMRHRGVCYRVSGTCFRCGKTSHMIRDYPIGSENTNRPVASSAAGSASGSKANVKPNTGKEPLRQGRVFVLVPGDVQNTESVVSGREDHENHLITVLQTLKGKKLYAKLSKYEFWLDSVAFLGHMINKNGVLVDPQKIEAIVD
ncbi:uncharacterized protein LOC114269809 [Camellia sinensis]|uniref:uncharacterized protein LOC114269809 n=1 Tax=Camellia sinensis TaxID=4442 RepID=UPI001035B0B9|nr:uncharacterized protein LOC114269809 [Camellia sinensis]